MATLLSLQGVVAKRSPEIYVRSSPATSLWLQQATQSGASRVEPHTDLEKTVSRFNSDLRGYIFYGPGNRGINEATSLAGILGGLIVNEHTLGIATRAGLKQIESVRGRDETWVWKNYSARFNRHVTASLSPDITGALRDLLILQNSFVTYNSPAMDQYFRAQTPHSLVLGWGPSELDFFQVTSRHSLQALATDYLLNGSALSQWKVAVPPQKTQLRSPLAVEHNVHYVAFVMSDGDNPQWLTNGFVTEPHWWGSALRGKFAMNWDLSPGLIDLSPLTYRHLHNTANAGTNADYFVTAHGVGTDYPSEVPALGGALDKTVRYMRATDQKVLSILDNRWEPRVIDQILDRPEIAGVMYKFNGCCGYASRNGGVYFHKGKPAIAVKYSLWDGYNTPREVAAGLNRAPRAPQSDAGSYSVVNVHPWSVEPLQKTWDTVRALAPHVRVVTLEELVARLRDNLGSRD